ncbi:PqiC family protein [Robbsia sp. Bb-Pol-6]|uniref:PqiC family protein n=1 Tax=Robbsia betulipollinis TaxID=2981849 RepID=A0ABT3ZSE4_9BURK|nr:PqiC family protein [Robbsia betulipollinis]MCY0388865.1 PqiC family protein [Robbsia betulipollinis]
MMSLPPLQHARRPGTRRRVGTALAAATALLLGACAHTPDSRFFTLSGSTPDNAGAAPGATVDGTALPMATPLLIEVLPVNIPGQVSRPQIVSTTGAGDVKLEEYNRWASPLADEIGGALSQSLTRSLGAIDSYRTPHPAGSTVYRITVNVQRFESVPGERATIDAVWSVVRSSDALTLTCRSTASEPVAPGYDNLAAGHRKALARIAADIAQGVRTEQGVMPPPPAVPVPMPAKPSATGGRKKAHAQADGASAAPVTPAAPPVPVLPCPLRSSPAP